MADHSKMKLGKLAPRIDSRVRKLSDYTIDGVTVPDTLLYYEKVTAPWPMLLNDVEGDCTIAAAGHACQLWGKIAWNDPRVISDTEAQIAYMAVSGFIPGQPNTDNGAVCLDVLQYWQTTGIGPHKIAHFLTADVHLLKLSTYLFGMTYVGIALPTAAQTQDVWDIAEGPDGEPGSWGGHCVPVVGYNEKGPIVITWGEIKQTTWRFWPRYLDEAYAVLSGEWIDAQRIATNDINWVQLRADLDKDFKPN